jgi:hypothetical protein
MLLKNVKFFALCALYFAISVAHAQNPQMDALGNTAKVAAVVTVGKSPAWSFSPFGGTGSQALNTFLIDTMEFLTLQVTDFQCIGDVFSIYNGDTLLFSTHDVDADGCAAFQPDPDLAFSNPEFSKGSFTLSPGSYNLRIVLKSSPYGGGTLALRAVAAISTNDVCIPKSYPRLMVVKSDSDHPNGFMCQEANDVCASRGLKKADLDIYNFLVTTNGAFECGGMMSRHWIRSWFGDTYNNACIALHLGSASPGGSINAIDANNKLAVLCQPK